MNPEANKTSIDQNLISFAYRHKAACIRQIGYKNRLLEDKKERGTFEHTKIRYKDYRDIYSG